MANVTIREITRTVATPGLSDSFEGQDGIGSYQTTGQGILNSFALGTFAFQNYATPPIIGGVTPNAGHFTTLSATGLVSTAASAAGGSGVNLPEGAAPTSPNNGDLWTTSGGLYVQIAGATVGPLGPTGSGPSSANPSGTIGLSVQNGAATTFMRSDAAPPLGVTISPTWTGNHLFNGSFGGTGVTTYLASPAAIGGSAPNGGAFTTLSASSTVSGAGFGNYLAAFFSSAFTVTNAGVATLSTNNRIRSVGTTFGDTGGSALTSGSVVYFTIPFAGTITGWDIAADAGTCTIDVWKIASGTAIPTIANTITASALPALASGTVAQSTTLTGWTTSVAANDIVAFDLKTVATAKFVSVQLNISVSA